MHVYAVFSPVTGLIPEFRATLAEAHANTKTWGAVPVIVQLRDYPLDKASVVKILNHMVADDDPAPDFTVLKTYTLTARGGLKEKT